MQTNEMRVIRDKEDAITQYGGAAVGSLLGVARDTSRHRARTRVVPNLSPRPPIQRLHLVGTGDVHNAIDHQRGRLEAEVRQGMNPCWPQITYILYIDVGKVTVTVTIYISRVGRPIPRPGMKNLLDGLCPDLFVRRGIGPYRDSTQAAQERHEVAILPRASAEGGHQRALFRHYLTVFTIEQQVKPPIERLQVQIMGTLATSKPAQSAAIPQGDIDNPVTCRDPCVRLLQRFIEFRQGRLAAYVGKIRAIASAAPLRGVALGTVATSKEQGGPCCCVASRSHLERVRIHRTHKVGQLLNLRVWQGRERRHIASTVLDQFREIFLAGAAEMAAIG